MHVDIVAQAASKEASTVHHVEGKSEEHQSCIKVALSDMHSERYCSWSAERPAAAFKCEANPGPMRDVCRGFLHLLCYALQCRGHIRRHE